MAKLPTRFPKATATEFSILSSNEFVKSFLEGDKALFTQNSIDYSTLYKVILYGLIEETPRLVRTFAGSQYNIAISSREQFIAALKGLEKSNFIKLASKIETSGDIFIKVDRSTKPWVITI